MDENIIQINLVEVASEIAALELAKKYAVVGDEDLLLEEVEEGVLTYKEEYQDEFNALYDYYYNFLTAFKIS